MTNEWVCNHVLVQGSVGETAEDETPSRMCGRPATFEIGRPDVRPKYRCDEHVQPFRDLVEWFPDMWIRPIEQLR